MSGDRIGSLRQPLLSIFVAFGLWGCGPDPAKQALLEQLVTAQSAVAAGVTPAALRDREVALRTAAQLAAPHLNRDQIAAVNAAIFAISKTREGWVVIVEFCDGSNDIVLLNDTFCQQNLRPIFEAVGAQGFAALLNSPDSSLNAVIEPLLHVIVTRVDAAIEVLR